VVIDAVPEKSERPRALSWLLPAAAVVLLLVSAALGGLLYRQRNHADQRAEALAAAKQTLINAYSVDFRTVEKDYQRFMAGTTDQLHGQLDEGRKKFLSTVKSTQTRERGTVADAGVVRFGGDTATVAIALDSPLMTKAAPKERMRRYRTEVDVRRVHGHWLATDIRQID
jgi:Mce-associated membrane protein